ncbi:phosphate signaling complex protein PhoU [Candidatus Cyanaurora vandensis]|uniref:phosphate signaling complex protein PhoU n=1 Tax=Candidatus Cyanaurora vandensis TaxID=2714958 RepID=UPI00257F00B6|nr:phosphate signaling complex protein PhoU [Candidatus Cyanaurora vandensis]
MVRASLERLIADLQQDTLRMGALVETSVAQGLQALFQQNLTLAEQVIQQDVRVDALYRKLEVDCLNALALHSPLARDLRYISTILQLIRDLERIGDYAGDICEVVPRLILYPKLPELDKIRPMAHRCQTMVSQALVVFTHLDSHGGRALIRADDSVDADYESLYNCLAVQRVGDGPLEPFLLLLLVIRYLERMADHAANIGVRVAFIVTGER